MAKLVALYKKPTNVSAFNTHYFLIQVPLAKRIPGLRRYEVSIGPESTPQGDSPYHLAAILSFESMAAIQVALNSPEGQSTATDLANYAQSGVELLVFDSRDL